MSTKNASGRPKKVEQSTHEGRFTKDELIGAVKKAFREIKGRIDPRYLWSDVGGHRFRVNCWASERIEYSEFVRVIEEGGKLTVRRNHGK